MGPMDDAALLAGLEGLAGDPGAGPMPPGGDGTVTCRACNVVIDSATGEPLGPVTQENVAAVQQYEMMSNQAMQGGAELDLGMGGPPPPGGPPMGGPPPMM